MTQHRVRRAQRAALFIETRLTEPLSAPDIARAAGGAVSELHRTFRQVHGLSLMAYVRGRRLTEAARLLVRTTLPVDTVGTACGYRDRAAFSRAFQRHFGCSPRDWRAAPRPTYLAVEPADLGSLVHRDGLPQQLRLHQQLVPLPLFGLQARVDPMDHRGFVAAARRLREQVGDVLATGMLAELHADGQITLFLGVPQPFAGHAATAALPAGSYGVLDHRGPAERVRDSVSVLAQREHADLVHIGERAHAERFDLGQLDGEELSLELWLGLSSADGRS